METKNTSDVNAQKLNVLIHAPSGFGKTWLAGTITESVIILSAESGLLSLSDKSIDYFEIKSTGEMHNAYNFLLNDKKYKWVVIDSASEIVSMCSVAKRKVFADARAAYVPARDELLDLFRKFRGLDKHILVTCQQGTVDTADGHLLAPYTDDKMLTQNLPFMFDAVFPILKQEHEGKVYHYIQTKHDNTHLIKYRDPLQRLKEKELCNIQRIKDKLITKGE